MEYNNRTELTCNDLQKFTEIMKRVSFKNSDIDIGERTALIRTMNALPEKDIEQLSKENPDLIFTADYSFESEIFETSHIVEYRNGESKGIRLKANYHFIVKYIGGTGLSDIDHRESKDDMIGESYTKLFERGMEILKRMDITKKNKKGQDYIDFVSGITLKIEDEYYQMRLSKNHTCIKVKCSRKELKLYGKAVQVGDSCPFE